MEKPTTFDRRSFLFSSSVLALGIAGGLLNTSTAGKKMGVASPSYALRYHRKIKGEKYQPFEDAMHLLEHCRQLGAGGIQVGIGKWDMSFAGKMKARATELGVYLEGQIALPKKESDVARFEQNVLQARAAGISILRTVCLSGRRYETFSSLEDFKNFEKNAYHSLDWVEPIVRKHKVMLAVENHKDWRIDEFHRLLRYFDSEWIRVNLDTGNNIALMEEPLEVVQALAPYTVTVHFKDMAYREYEDGFLLSEVPLGKGILNLTAMKSICEAYYPPVNFNLEMITRDPLEIPCLTDTYWNTFEGMSATELAKSLHRIRHKKHQEHLPMITGKTADEQLAFEEENVLASFAYAKQRLGFD